MSACRDDSVAAPDEPTVEQRASALSKQEDGPTPKERAATAIIARSIAAAIEDPDARRYLFDAMASTDGREHKLHLRSFLEGRGAPLLQAAERRTGTRSNNILQALQDSRELELYMPVSGHRAKWTVDVVPLVIVALSDDDQPVAYDAAGNAQPLSREHPPTRPVIAAVPLETDFT